MIAPGALIGGRYRVVRLLGEGAMGAVYEAIFESIGRRVAVKVLHGRYDGNRDAVARFSREALAAGSVVHDHIVPVIDLGAHEGLPYIAMEYLEGESLAEAMAADEPMDSRRAVRIAAEVLSALASTHAAGIVHRDLKPENVFLERRPGRDESVRLLDFGISKIITAEASDHRVTREGMVLGTPSYMSPEQWTSQPDVDHRADLFAVGVLLYEMLTGGLPYEGDTQAELFVEVVQCVDEPPPPSEIAPGVPAAIDGVILRALRRDRNERHPSARAFLEALRPFGAGDIAVTDAPPASADPDRVAPRMRRSPAGLTGLTVHAGRRGRRLAAISLVGAVTVIIATGAVALSKVRSGGRPVRVTASPATSGLTAPATDVRIELVGLPSGASVLLDGLGVTGPAFRVARSDTARRLEIHDESGVHALSIVPDRDRSILLEALAPPSPARDAGGAPSRHEIHRERPGRGLGALDPLREF